MAAEENPPNRRRIVVIGPIVALAVVGLVMLVTPGPGITLLFVAVAASLVVALLAIFRRPSNR
jgi:Na+/H+ antiporter NhaD/arsenite permease-like protein